MEQVVKCSEQNKMSILGINCLKHRKHSFWQEHDDTYLLLVSYWIIKMKNCLPPVGQKMRNCLYPEWTELKWALSFWCCWCCCCCRSWWCWWCWWGWGSAVKSGAERWTWQRWCIAFPCSGVPKRLEDVLSSGELSQASKPTWKSTSLGLHWMPTLKLLTDAKNVKSDCCFYKPLLLPKWLL